MRLGAIHEHGEGKHPGSAEQLIGTGDVSRSVGERERVFVCGRELKGEKGAGETERDARLAESQGKGKQEKD